MLGLGTGINKLSSAEASSIASRSGGYLLDTYSGAAAAYSLRQLSSSYSGNAVKVRRSSDNTETDIGFVGGELDTASLSSFAGAGDAFVVSWFDQSSNSNDATQTVTANQPKIVSSGAVIVENGKPALELDGVNDQFPLTLSSININNLSSFAVGKADSGADSGNGDIMLSLSGGTASRWYTPYVIGTNTRFGYGDTSNAANTPFNTNHNLFTMIAGSIQGNMSAFLSGSLIGTATLQSGFDSVNPLAIGGYFSTTFSWNGKIQEVVVYDSDESTNRTNIESNIATFYDITL